MRRVAAACVLLVVACAVALTACSGSDDRYRVDAIFDNVAFLTPGQQVRIAGATIGSIEELSVTGDHKARVRMTIDPRFAPFRADADCTIQPQSLIGERFVQCVPGTPAAPALEQIDGTPTLPVERTHAPVDLDLILSTFDLPSRQRLGILLGSLGAGLAGQGDNLGDAILRANPALEATRGMLGVLDRDRAQLRGLITDGDAVLRPLAARSDRVAAFIRRAADVAGTTAAHRAGLAESVRRAPAFLDEARPALTELASFARAGTPLLDGLRRSGPGLDELLRDTGSFAEDVRPALDRLAPVLAQTRAALPDLTPQVARLGRFAKSALPAGTLVDELFTSLEDRGALDGLMSFFHFASIAFSRYDKFSHILPAFLMGNPCMLYAKAPLAGCSSKYSSFTGLGERKAPDRARRRPAKRRPTRPVGAAPTPAPSVQSLLPQLPELPLPKLPLHLQIDPQQTVDDLLDYLLDK
jgi:virulence factor Mce-like protein